MSPAPAEVAGLPKPIGPDAASRRDFILANTEILSPPHVPELRLHLASEAFGLWRRTEEELQQIGLPPPYWAFAWAGGQALARYLLDNQDIARGRTVIDIGTGCGIAAIAAGNAVVIKPDSQTVLTALIGARLLEEAGFPKDLWQTVAGAGSKIGPEMISRADYICFTGSTATGKIIAKGCADRLIGCSLELGGKNPILILRDADINRAVEGAVRATFSNAGQLCVSTERMYVADAIYDRFKEKFVAAVKAMTLRPGLDWGNDMGTLTGPSQLEAVTKHVEDAKAKGATVLAGGRARPDLGPYFYEPTILEGVNPEMKCFGEETFGPVISLYRFTDEADAIARANQGEYGLNGSIYSRDTKRARAMAKRIKCGTVNVNEAFAATFASIDAPMGGMRESGQGRRQGAEGLLRYTETQAVAVQRLLRFGPSFGLNDKKFAGVMTANLKLLKKIGRP